MANQFNNYFVTVAEKLTEKIGQTNNKYQDYLKNQMNTVCEIEPDEIRTQIKSLNSKKISDIYRDQHIF